MQHRPHLLALGVVLLACSGSNENEGARDAGAAGEDAALVCQPVVQLHGSITDHVSNLESCGNFWVRRGPADCLPDEPSFRCTVADEGNECNVDADCTARADGACVDRHGCRCVYACATDDDCGDKEACLCPAGMIEEGGFYGLNADNGCLPAQCRSEDDCGGRPCIVAEDDCGTPIGFVCWTGRDTCQKDDDCAAPNDRCAFKAAARRFECTESFDCW